MTNQDLVLKDIERCKALAPIMQGIEPDDKWYNDDGEWYLLSYYDSLAGGFINHYGTKNDLIPTWRQDKLALRLHSCCKKTITGFSGYIEAVVFNNNGTGELISELHEAVRRYKKSFIDGDIQLQLESTADLLILLNNEGLL